MKSTAAFSSSSEQLPQVPRGIIPVPGIPLIDEE